MCLFGTPKQGVIPVIVRSVQKESGMKLGHKLFYCSLSEARFLVNVNNLWILVTIIFHGFLGSNEYLALVKASFETNPLDKPEVDQLLKAFLQPVEIVYDAVSKLSMLSFAIV